MEIKKEIVDQLTESINEGHTKKEIQENDNISRYQLNCILKELNNPESKVYNPELYKELVSKLQKNVFHKRSLNAKENKKQCIDCLFPNKKMGAAKLILEKHLSLEQVALQLHIFPTKLYYDLKTMRNEELEIELQPALEQFEKDYRERKDKKLRNYPKNIQEDIILTALTFRVSLKSMTILFNTTIDDIIAIYFSFDKYWDTLMYLCEEVQNEEEHKAHVAYTKAKIYWNNRNKLAKQINENTNKQEKEKIKAQLKELHAEIDDTIVLGTIGKNLKNLSMEEKDAIAKFRPKYFLGLTECAEKLHHNKESIRKCEEDLAARNLIYAEQLSLLNHKFDEFSDKLIIADYRKKYAKDNAFLEEQQAVEDSMNFSRGGGSK